MRLPFAAFLGLAVVASSFSGFGLLGGLIIVPHIPLLAAIGLGIILYIPSFLAGSFNWTLRRHDYYALAFVELTIVSALLHPNNKSVFYILVYALSYIVFSIGLRLIGERHDYSQPLLNANLMAVIAVSAFCVVEFFLEAYFKFDIQEHLPRLNRGNAICTLGVPRAYGPAIEPTYLSWYFNTLGLLAIHRLWHRSPYSETTKIIATCCFVFAYCAAFSIAAFLSLLAAVAIVYLFFAARAWRSSAPSELKLSQVLPSRPVRAAALVILPAAFFVANVYELVGPEGAAACFGRGVEKATLTQTDEATSVAVPVSAVERATVTKATKDSPPVKPATTVPADAKRAVEPSPAATMSVLEPKATDNAPVIGLQTGPNASPVPTEAKSARPVPRPRIKIDRNRRDIWMMDLQTALKNPITGMGPGYKSSIDEYSSVNLFLFVALEQGVPALLALLAFYGSVFWWMARSPFEDAWLYHVGYTAGVLQLGTMTQHHFTNVWLLLMLFSMIIAARRRADLATTPPAATARPGR